MSGAFLCLVIILLLWGIYIIGNFLEYVGRFIGIIIVDIISALKKKSKKEKQIVQQSNKQPEMTAKQLIEEYYEKPRAHNKKANNNFDYSNTEEEFYCERCYKKITEEEYEEYDGMCEECFDEVNFNNML